MPYASFKQMCRDAKYEEVFTFFFQTKIKVNKQLLLLIKTS